MPVPQTRGGRITLAVDAGNRLRSDVAASGDRLFCHTYGRGRGSDQFIPGRPYSFVAALEPGPRSWTALPDAIRPTPSEEATEVTAARLRAVAAKLIGAGHRIGGAPPITVVADAGYDAARLARLQGDLPVPMVTRVRADRVYRREARAHRPGMNERPATHGARVKPPDPATWPEPDSAAGASTARHGAADTSAWHRPHPTPTHHSGRPEHEGEGEGEGEPPILPGTLIRLQVEHLPGSRDPDPVWLRCSAPEADLDPVTACRTMFQRRFDLEHTFRFLKQALGWTRPKLRDPAAADRRPGS